MPTSQGWTDRSESDWRGPGEGHTCTHARAFSLDHVMPGVEVKNVLFSEWKEGKELGRAFLSTHPQGRWALPHF